MKTAKRLLLECVRPCVELTNAIKEHADQDIEDALRQHMVVYYWFEEEATRFITGQRNELFESMEHLLCSFEDLLHLVESVGDVAKATDKAYSALDAAGRYIEGICQ